MPVYRYKVVGASGRIEAGSIDAADRTAAVTALRAKGLLPIEAREVRSSEPFRIRWPFKSGPVLPAQLGLVLQEFSVLLEAGLPLDRTLELLSGQPASQRLKPTLVDIQRRVRSGATLSEAVRAHPAIFPPSVSTLIEAGEAGGSLDMSLSRAADMLLKSAALREVIVGALIYPAVLLGVVGISLTIIVTVVLPAFKSLFDEAGAALPLPTQIVMAVGDAVGAYWFPGFLCLGIASLAARHILRRADVRLKLDRRLLRAPLLGPIVTKIETARFARTLGTLIDNGIPLPTALGITHRGFANIALAQAVDRVGKSLKEGEGLAGPLEATRLFPAGSLHLIHVGEETARLGEMLGRLADILDREIQRSIQRTLALLVPLVTVVLGVMIAGIIVSILLAVLQLNDLAK